MDTPGSDIQTPTASGNGARAQSLMDLGVPSFETDETASEPQGQGADQTADAQATDGTADAPAGEEPGPDAAGGGDADGDKADETGKSTANAPTDELTELEQILNGKPGAGGAAGAAQAQLDDARLLTLERAFGADVAAEMVRDGDAKTLAIMADRLAAAHQAGQGSSPRPQADAASPKAGQAGEAAPVTPTYEIPAEAAKALQAELGQAGYTKGLKPVLDSVFKAVVAQAQQQVTKLAQLVDQRLVDQRLDATIDRLGDDRFGTDADSVTPTQRAARERLVNEALRVQQRLQAAGRTAGAAVLFKLAAKQLQSAGAPVSGGKPSAPRAGAVGLIPSRTPGKPGVNARPDRSGGQTKAGSIEQLNPAGWAAEMRAKAPAAMRILGAG